MRIRLNVLTMFLLAGCMVLLQNCKQEVPENWKWETLETTGEPVARHEAGMVAYKDKLYLMGGRRINPTSVYDVQTNTWENKSETPVELHHFQPVVFGDAIYILGAMSGQWPNEKPLDKVIVYYPEKDEYVYSHPIPEHRRRGGAGAAVYNGKIYLVGGITKGHMNGYQAWFDEYDPTIGEWKVLDDAPNTRDHFSAVASNNKLYAFAGRRTSKATEQDMALTVSHGNVYDFKTQKWEPVVQATAIPTMRAGNFAFAWNGAIVIGGGESTKHEVAHNEVEAYDGETKRWSKWPSLNEGRHGTGFAVVGKYVYVASGSGNRGGGPELTTLERLELPQGKAEPISAVADTTPVFAQWHTIELPFVGPQTSETDADNPFLNYRLRVEFEHEENKQVIRGFFAADGNAAETSAEVGSVWMARFTPNKVGNWKYKAVLQHGDSLALSDDLSLGDEVKLGNASGEFVVVATDKEGPDFRGNGRLGIENTYFKFEGTDKFWMKGGSNSPENLLAFKGIDGTYRMLAEAREGEAAAPEEIHTFAPHLKDWKAGDPTWQDGKGKALIGGINYLASKGMNSMYFLTLNILGDGKDVWPYHSPDDFTRFDVSKLEQWEIVFQHMQKKGILLHVVLQETENETMLDGGDTGPMRQLYLREMIARFGHHLGLIWNLGEENGPASFSPIGQNDEQRRAMTSFLKKADPYQHPVLLHTHSHNPPRKDILGQIVGFKDLDGLSLQVDKREGVSEVIQTWKEKSKEAGQEWLITMDEIGMWHTGAQSDSLDPQHETLRRYVLWGTLLSGGAGVEWYFGANSLHNDLNSEDWRRRDRLWELTDYAVSFCQQNLPYWEMQPEHGLVSGKGAYCLKKEGEVYAVYLPKAGNYTLDLSKAEGEFSVQWFNPLEGGEMQKGSVESITGGGVCSLGKAPQSTATDTVQDWVVLVKKG
ncbi:DUF5060 domain-containing protein [Flammeovirgaceae bacterium SG7u.111]|nr:DUF5060 domain-containing protein [Flammeovirgaceae bacterium SG7u.132]WPO35998.1 DUF5060 domain-containing protein [Flammeovirgaceae bacterium SG7u.111]